MKNSDIIQKIDLAMLWLDTAEAVDMDEVCLGSSDVISSGFLFYKVSNKRLECKLKMGDSYSGYIIVDLHSTDRSSILLSSTIIVLWHDGKIFYSYLIDMKWGVSSVG